MTAFLLRKLEGGGADKKFQHLPNLQFSKPFIAPYPLIDYWREKVRQFSNAREKKFFAVGQQRSHPDATISGVCFSTENRLIPRQLYHKILPEVTDITSPLRLTDIAVGFNNEKSSHSKLSSHLDYPNRGKENAIHCLLIFRLRWVIETLIRSIWEPKGGTFFMMQLSHLSSEEKEQFQHFKDFYETYVESPVISGEQVNGRCPFHEDRKPSFSASLMTGLWTCHAGCGSGNAHDFAIKNKSDEKEVPFLFDNVIHYIESIYRYRDENKKSLYDVVRFTPKTFRFRRKVDDEKYVWNSKGVSHVLYQLPRLIRAIKKGRKVFLVEGEKDVRNLLSLKLVATTSPKGAGKWHPDYSRYFNQADVVLLPDNDEEGQKHMQQVAESLSGYAKSIKIVPLPLLPPKGDVSDWIDAGGDKQKLLELVKKAPIWSSTTTNIIPSGGGNNEPVLVTDLINQYKNSGELKINWLWDSFIPKGSKVLLTGFPKSGKSTFCRHLVTAIANGLPFAGFETTKTKILWIGLEEPTRDTIQRFEKLGASENLLYLSRPFNDSKEDIQRLKKWVLEKQIGLVVIDTLDKYWRVQDENSASQTVASLSGLIDLTQSTNVTVILIHHIRKAPGRDGSDIRGSSAIFGTVDVSLTLRRDKDPIRKLETQARYDQIPEALILELKDDGYHSQYPEELKLQKLKLIRQGLSDKPQTAGEISNKVGISESSVRRFLRDLTREFPKEIIRCGKKPEKYRNLSETIESTTTQKHIGGGIDPRRIINVIRFRNTKIIVTGGDKFGTVPPRFTPNMVG